MRARDFDIHGWMAPRCMTIEEAEKKGEMDALISLKSAQEVFATLDRQIDYLKARVAKLEKADMFWPADDPETSEGNPHSAVWNLYGYVPLMQPVELQRAVSLPNQWVVITQNEDDDDTTEHLFDTQEEAEAFCQKMRAEKGEGA